MPAIYVPPPYSSSAAWGPALCQACWTPTYPSSLQTTARNLLQKIIQLDVEHLKNQFMSCRFGSTEQSDSSSPPTTEGVWNYLLGPTNIKNGVKHIPFDLHRIIFCSHSIVAVLDCGALPEIESGMLCCFWPFLQLSGRENLPDLLQRRNYW